MSYSRRHLLQGSLAGGAAGILSGLAKGQEGGGADTIRKKPRGIIFCVSDGMSQGVLSMTEAFSNQLRGKGTTWWELLAGGQAVLGLMDTASSSSMVTDSAAASSAWSSGKRVPNGQINFDANGRRLESIGETLEKKRVRLGLVSTASITHATPAGFASSVIQRGQEDLIAPQYLNRVDVILGGGSRFFDPKVRRDKKDLFGSFAREKYDVVRSRDGLLKSKSRKILGTFSPGYIPYTIDRDQDKEMQKMVPTLAEMSGAAVSRFLDDDAPFLLQIEGARIDHAAHKNDIGAILHEQMAFDDAVAKVLAMTKGHDDILVILTSDHGNANPGLNGTGAGYRQTNDHFAKIAQIKGSAEFFLQRWNQTQSKSAAKLNQLMEATYGFKPSPQELEALMDRCAGKKVTEWSHQLSNPVGLLGQIVGNVTGVGWTGICHTSDPTQLTSIGPGAGEFSGLVRNDSIRERLLGLLLG
ncbi:MAG: alkaline phosphatase [Akkermansiaceae bacterium]|jgi:alkaline phosphatase